MDIYEGIKNYLLAHPEFFVNEGLPPLEKKNFCFGVADLLKLKNKLIVAIVPQTESEYENDNDITCYQKITDVVVSFISRFENQNILDTKTMKYAVAFRKAFLSDPLFDDAFDNSMLGERNYYLDAGTVEMQLSAVECNLSVITHDTI